MTRVPAGRAEADVPGSIVGKRHLSRLAAGGRFRETVKRSGSPFGCLLLVGPLAGNATVNLAFGP